MAPFEQRGKYIHAYLVYGVNLGNENGWSFREVTGDGNLDLDALYWIGASKGEYVGEDQFVAALQEQLKDYAVGLLKTGDPEDYGSWLLVYAETMEMKADGPDVYEVDPSTLVSYGRFSPAEEVIIDALAEAGLNVTQARPRWYLVTTWG